MNNVAIAHNYKSNTQAEKEMYSLQLFHTLYNNFNSCNNIEPTLLHCGIEIQCHGHIKQIAGGNTFVTQLIHICLSVV